MVHLLSIQTDTFDGSKIASVKKLCVTYGIGGQSNIGGIVTDSTVGERASAVLPCAIYLIAHDHTAVTVLIA